MAGQPSTCAGVGASNARSNHARAAGAKTSSTSTTPAYFFRSPLLEDVPDEQDRSHSRRSRPAHGLSLVQRDVEAPVPEPHEQPQPENEVLLHRTGAGDVAEIDDPLGRPAEGAE